MRVYSEERIRDWTNQRVRAEVKAGRQPGPESSVGKVHQGGLNQRIQPLAVDILGAGATGVGRRRRRPTRTLPPEVRGMLRSRANTIEGGTTEVNKNILGERVLGLPREPDPYQRAVVARDPALTARASMAYETLRRRTRRSGRLAGLQPARRGQRDGRAHDARARGRVARARRRPAKCGSS